VFDALDGTVQGDAVALELEATQRQAAVVGVGWPPDCSATRPVSSRIRYAVSRRMLSNTHDMSSGPRSKPTGWPLPSKRMCSAMSFAASARSRLARALPRNSAMVAITTRVMLRTMPAT
jgi:hypothetical protein